MISTNQLTKVYKKHKALNNVNMHVKKGEIYGLVGKNGAGKTTLLKILSGLAYASEGEFELCGYKGKDITIAKTRVGALIEHPGFYPNMTGYDNLKLKCLALGVKDEKIVDDLLECVGLNEQKSKKVKEYSLGMKQRLGIAFTLIGKPDLVILDEPINGLDPQGIADIRNVIQKLNKEKRITFLISSHILEELAKIATSYGFIEKGVLMKELTREELFENCGKYIEICAENVTKICTIIEEMGITKYKVVNPTTINIYERIDESADIIFALSDNRIKTKEITIRNLSLEEYFLKVVGGAEDV